MFCIFPFPLQRVFGLSGGCLFVCLLLEMIPRFFGKTFWNHEKQDKGQDGMSNYADVEWV